MSSLQDWSKFISLSFSGEAFSLAEIYRKTNIFSQKVTIMRKFHKFIYKALT